MLIPAERAPRYIPSLGTWLAGLLLSAVCLVLLGTVLLIENFARAHAERRAIDALQLVATDFRDALDRGMAQQFRQLIVLAQLEPLQQTARPAALRRTLEQIQQGFSHFAWLGVTDAQGRVLAASGGLLEGVDVSARPWWQGGRQAPFVGDVHAAVLLERLLPKQPEPWRFVDFALPLPGAAGEGAGVLGAHLSWSWAREVKAELIDSTLASHRAEALVLDRHGKVILGPPALEGQLLPSQGGPSRVEREFDGEAFYVAVLPTRGHERYPGLGWQVLVRQPVAVALADYFSLRRQIGYCALALLILFLPLSWWLARRLSAPLRQLAAAITARHHLGEGELPRVGGYREAQLLSNALAELAQRQAEQDASLSELNASLEQRVQARTAELRDAMRQLAASEQRLLAVTDNIPAMVGYFDREQHCHFANSQALKVHGLSASQALGMSLRAGLGEASYALHEPYVRQVLAGQSCHFIGALELGGADAHFQAHLVPDLDAGGLVQGFYLMSFDITRLKRAERELAALSRVDSLTGVPNRRHFDERLPEAMARCQRGQQLMALMFLDLDKFKSINDGLGHAAGDAVLQAFAQRLRACVRGTDLVCRLAGDEFVLLLEGLHAPAEAGLVAQKVLDAVAQPLQLAQGPLQLSTSIGIACYQGEEPADPASLLARADQALYAAKAAGRGCFRYAEGEAAG